MWRNKSVAYNVVNGEIEDIYCMSWFGGLVSSLLLSKQDIEAKNAGEFNNSIVKYNKKM